MNNWRLLLLAVVVVVQPIGSFTESNLIDGHECSERFENQLYRYRKTAEHRTLDGTREERRTNEERRLSSLDENPDWRYEVKRTSMITRSERSLERSETRISPELNRFPRDQERFSRVTGLRVTREGQNNNRDETRSFMAQNERDSSDAAHTVRLSRDARNARFIERESRNTMSRLPIRTSRSVEEPSKETATLQRQCENIVRSDTRRDAWLSGTTRSDSQMQLDNRERTTFDHRTQNEENRHSRFTNARVSIERRAERNLNEGNDRDSRVVRVDLRRQRDIELKNSVSAVRRDSERISADRMRESRDESARLVRDKLDASNKNTVDERRQERDESRRSTEVYMLRNTKERQLGSQQNRDSGGLEVKRNVDRMDRRSLSMDRLSTLRESRNSGLSKAFDRYTSDEGTARNRDKSSNERRLLRENRLLSRDRAISPFRDSNNRMQESNRVVARRDARKSLEERRQQRDISLTRERTSIPLREVRNTEHTEKSRRTIRDSSEERRLQRDSSRLSQDMLISRLRENREDRDTTRGTQELRRIVSPLHTEVNSRKIDSKSHQYIRDYERPDLRRQVLQRSMESAFRRTRSTSAERRQDIKKPRASRSAVASRARDDTRTNERDDRRQTQPIVQQVAHQRADITRSSRNENIRLDRVIGKRDDVRGIGDRDMSIERTILQRDTRNVAPSQRFDSRSSARTESNRLDRQVRNRAEVRENERKEMLHDDDRTFRIVLNRRSSERVFAERRLENRHATKDSRNVQNQMSRNRDEVRIGDQFESRRQHDAFSRTRERVLAERRQENRETDSRNVRGERRNLVKVRTGRVVAVRRDNHREVVRDSRNDRDETRKLEKARSERILAERRQDNRDSRNVRDENERFDSRRQRVAIRESRGTPPLQRETRDITERLAEMFRESTARPESRNERATRNIERQVRFDRDLRTSENVGRRESRNGIRANYAMEFMERTASPMKARDDSKRQENSFRNIDGTFRDAMDSEKSDESVFSNWPIFYTLQGVYLCGLLVQMLTENANKTKKRTFNWWSSHKNLIKVD